uniref:TAT-variant-translocated molybdopterin oxidoreductase n=1 Tax=uncultured Abyssibacter sp. TaxID=2320202 RepID=UPI0032B2164E
MSRVLRLDELRSSLDAVGSGPRYWRSLDELAGTADFGRLLREEFPRLAPLWEQSVDRRGVLKLMAASLALAGLGGCGRPAEEIVPYVKLPAGATPGRARHYATSLRINGHAHGVIAKTVEGRPVKLEGNPDHPSTLGACDSWTQAAVLGLYDPDRSRTPRYRDQVATAGAFLEALAPLRKDWDETGGAGLALLLGERNSPSEQARWQALRRRWPRARWFSHVTVNQQAALDGAALLFGKPLQPVVDLDGADAIVSLDADLLATEPGFLAHARHFAAGRRAGAEDSRMNRLYVAESAPTVTGAAADHRVSVAADRIDGLARALASGLGLDVPGGEAAGHEPWLRAAIDDLTGARRPLVVAGSQQPAVVHALALAMNAHLGAIGRGLRLREPEAPATEPLSSLVEAVRDKSVDCLICVEANPLYDAPADLEFAAAFGNIPLRIHWGERVDETARLSHWHVPATHDLESWGDARAFDGTVSLIQPLIEPLYDSRTALQFIELLDSGLERDARGLLQTWWREASGQADRFETDWQRWLTQGVVDASTPETATPQPRAGWLADLPEPPAGRKGLLLQFRPHPTMFDGRYANNGWLQELPAPITKQTWGNAAQIAPATAQRLAVRDGDLLRLTLPQRSVELPVIVVPGHPADAITLLLGQGREAAGRVGSGVGVNVAPLRGSTAPWFVSGATIERTGSREPLALTQNHHLMEGRELYRAADLASFRTNPGFAQEPAPQESLYPEPSPNAKSALPQWGMSIDLNTCIGCNACLTACQAENNIPVVGADEVARGHEMHWIRIDRYYEGEPAAPRMAFQPVPCMHCENAPCEYVCPVEATQHSDDGLNEMVYNRCVGTRYCSQNCPYKVRRFNWFDYTNTAALATPKPANNPDVTVRSRGVMEKCTYCVQRIRDAGIEADIRDLPLADGDVVTACQQACP